MQVNNVKVNVQRLQAYKHFKLEDNMKLHKGNGQVICIQPKFKPDKNSKLQHEYNAIKTIQTEQQSAQEQG